MAELDPDPNASAIKPSRTSARNARRVPPRVQVSSMQDPLLISRAHATADALEMTMREFISAALTEKIRRHEQPPNTWIAPE